MHYIYIMFIIVLYIMYYIYISKIRHLLLNELYFVFFQTFEDQNLRRSSNVWKKPKYNSLSNKCLIFDIYIDIDH